MKPEDTHDRVHELLPWYVNETLSADERAMVERHVASCAACGREFQTLSQIGAAVTALAPDAPDPAVSLARTFASIDRIERREPRARVAAWWRAVWTPSVPVARVALAVQLAIILVLGALVLPPPARESSFTTLSGSPAASAGARLTVVFVPNATEDAIRQALLDVDGAIVSGPSAAGVYVVRLPGRTDDARVEAAIENLRRRSSVIRFVEREP
jgi:anti-sigma factor RsiW